MAFEDVSSQIRYVKYAEAKPGDILAIGVFTHKEMDQLYQKPRYYVTGDDGATTVLNSSGHLDWSMQRVKPGDYVRVVFEGQTILDSGKFKGKPAYRFSVQVDPERRVCGAEAKAAVAADPFDIAF